MLTGMDVSRLPSSVGMYMNQELNKENIAEDGNIKHFHMVDERFKCMQ